VRVDEHTISLAGSPVFYRSAPAAGTPPLYLHGVPTSSDDWTVFLERTGGIAPDLIGFGRSGKGGHLDYSLDGLTDFVEALLGHLDVERIKMIGHGWGAAVAATLAQRRREHVERLVLCNPLPLGEGFRCPRLGRLWRRPVIGELVMGSTSRWMLGRLLRRGCVRPDAWSQARIAAVWEQFDQGTQRAILRLHRSTDAHRFLGADAPALVIWGELDPWFPVELADAYAARFPGATLERVPNAGHWPWMDQPGLIERVAAYLG
jgi:pimeloyl-ACP methyl ester carboxylesterase